LAFTPPSSKTFRRLTKAFSEELMYLASFIAT
jgi:hypothetical protein